MSEAKTCRGPLHPQGRRLPLTPEHWYFYRRGERTVSSHACRYCVLHLQRRRRPPNSGWTLLSPRARWAVRELVGRLGITEAGRRADLSAATLRKMREDDGTRRFHRSAVAKMLVALRDARSAGEMRHKDSVAYGATVRQPTSVKGWTRRNDGVVVPDHERPAGKERKAERVYQQAGPVFPEIEALEREQDARRAKEKRAALREQERRERALEDLAGY